MLSVARSAWDLSNMVGGQALRGKALYEALMRLKPAELPETEWATAAGVNRGFFANLKGADISPRSDTLRKLLSFIGKDERDLYDEGAARASQLPTVAPITSAADEPKTWRVDGGEVVQLQKLDLSLSMGPGTLIDDYVESEPVSIDLAFIRAITRSPPERLRLVSGIGDSMYPTLNWGDVIMIDTTDRGLGKQDGIYWIDLYGAAGLKRLRTVGPGRILVKSDNPTVGDQEVDAADLRIEGRAIWVARGL